MVQSTMVPIPPGLQKSGFRSDIRTVGFGAENRSMCITLLVSTARFVTETDRPNVLPRRCECDGYCPLMDMGRLVYHAFLIVDGHG